MTFNTLDPVNPSSRRKPGLYYGYIVVIACFIMLMFGWGLFYNYGVFFGPLEQSFGWTRALTSGALSLSLLISGFTGIAAGRLSDRFGPKIIIIFCAVFLSAGYMLMAVVQNAWQFYTIYAVFISTGIGGFWSPQVSTVARWFTGKRGLMTGIVSGGIGFGTMITPPLLTQLIKAYDWRLTYFIVGIAVLMISVIAAQFIKFSPPATAQRIQNQNQGAENQQLSRKGYSLQQALRTGQFWIVAVIYFCFGLVQLTVMVHIIPFAVGEGISDINAASILSIIGGVSLAARIIMGTVSDRIRTKSTMIICLGLMTSGLLWLPVSDSLWKLYIFAVLFGFGYGGLSCLQPLIAAELYGLTALGVITAIFGLGFDIGGAVGPVLAGHIFDISRSYQWAFVICFGVALAALIVGITVKLPKK